MTSVLQSPIYLAKNIMKNCIMQDKRMEINEKLTSWIDIVYV